MIFVTVGTCLEGFDRLVKMVDDLVSDGVLDDVFIQIGYSRYEPRSCKFQRFIPIQEYDKLIKTSEVIVTSGGAGAIGKVLMAGKIPVVFPRLPEYNEIFGDLLHALQLSRRLAEQGKVIIVSEKEEFKNAIELAKSHRHQSAINAPTKIIKIIREFIDKKYGRTRK